MSNKKVRFARPRECAGKQYPIVEYVKHRRNMEPVPIRRAPIVDFSRYTVDKLVRIRRGQVRSAASKE